MPAPRCILLPPVAFLQRPACWLEAVSRYRATTSGGPNFAYDLCVRKIRPQQREAFDLSSWTIAFNGAEPVQPETLDRFAAAFEPCGFRREAFYPCYGLAEATLFVAGGVKMRGAGPQAFQRDALEQKCALPAAAGDAGARPLVSCGHAWLEQRIRIVDPDSPVPCAPDRVGEIWVAGTSVALGYWNRPEESAATFQARLDGADDDRSYLRTGDLGFFSGGELYVTGRLKDLLIIRGRNHYPQDIERTVERCDPELRLGEGAAFAVEADGEERLVVVQEAARGSRQEALAATVEAIRRSVAEEHEIQAYAVVLLRAGSILKTSSGKIQRQAVRKAFLAGTLSAVFQWQAGASTETDAAAPAAGAGLAAVQEWIATQVAARLGFARPEVDVVQPLVRYGLDSLADIEILHAIEQELGASLPVLSFLQDASIADLAAQVVAQLAAPIAPPDPPAAVRGGEFPLSRGQQALWFLHRLAPESAAYNVAGAARVQGPFDVTALRRAFQVLADRHASLRVRFEARGGAPVQVVQEVFVASFSVEDAAGWPDTRLAERLREEAARVRPGGGPVFRIHCWSREEEGLLLFAAHHIAVDLWSLARLVRSGARSMAQNAPEGPRACRPWQQATRTTSSGRSACSPENEVCGCGTTGESGSPASFLSSTSRPTDRGPSRRLPAAPPNRSGSTAGRRRGWRRSPRAAEPPFSRSCSPPIRRSCTASPTRRRCSSALPLPGRLHSRFDSVVGYFVNPVVIRLTAVGEPSFDQLVAQARSALLAALEHQEFPFPLLVDRLQPERDPSRSPLFQTMFVLQKPPAFADPSLAAFALGEPGARLKLGPLTLESVRLDQRLAQFDLTMAAARVGGELIVSLQYNTDLFEAVTARRMLGHFESLLNGVSTVRTRSSRCYPC